MRSSPVTKERSYPGSGPAHISTIPLKAGGTFEWGKSLSTSHEKEGGQGSGRHKTVGQAVDDYNSKVKKKLSKFSVSKHEADSSSANAAVLKDKKQESNHGSLKVRTHLKESDGLPSINSYTKFKVVLIQEGMGNLRDCYFYTKDCLKNAVPLFDGVKCYADHPDDFEEAVRPERCVRDILGHFEEVQYLENEGVGCLEATLCLLDGESFDWAKSLLVNCLEYASKYVDSDFVGLSINAKGEASEVPIQEFMKSQSLSDSVMEKLNEAVSQGIDTVRPVSILKDAVSCDLVTEAGAGGKILTMMERDKKPMLKKKKFKEAKHEAHEEADQQHEEDGDGAGADHADADQDKALFQKMIKQYLGDDSKDVDQEEAMQMAKHAMEAHKEEGMSHEEAYEASGKHLKMAMKIGKSMKQKKEEEAGHHEEESDKEHEEAQTPPPNAKGDDSGAKSATGDSKESVRGQLVKANAELARLRESVSRIEMKDYLTRKLESCGKSLEFIKLFKESLGKPKSKSHVDETFKLFEKAYNAGQKEESSDDDFVFTEKTTIREASSGKVISMHDCMVE